MQGKDAPPSPFDKDGVTFICPSGWSITDEDTIENEGYYISLEKNGFDASGLMTITWLYNDLDPKELITVYQEDMKANTIYKYSNLEFTDFFESESEYYRVTSVRYTLKLLGVKHQGIISSFNYGDRTFSILKQEADEDVVENKKGFEMIENSFKIKKFD